MQTRLRANSGLARLLHRRFRVLWIVQRADPMLNGQQSIDIRAVNDLAKFQ